MELPNVWHVSAHIKKLTQSESVFLQFKNISIHDTLIEIITLIQLDQGFFH